MSKGNNSFDSDAYLLHSMQELIAGTFRNASNEFSKTLGDEIRKVFTNEFLAKNSRNLTSKEIDNGFKLVLNRLEKMGLKPDNEFKSEMRSLINAMKKYTNSPTGNISQVELINKFIKDIETFIKASQDASRKGEAKYFENISGGKVGKEILKEIRESLNGRRNGILGRIDDTTEKLLDFLGEQKKENKKNLENFGKELLDGLEKSRFVGGALTDTFKLLGLMGASWLSQFGQLGRILGGAFYVVMSTMGPQLVNLLLKGMGSLFWNTTKFLGSKLLDLGKFLGTKFLDLGKFAGRGLLNMSMKAGGPLADLVTAETTSQKALAVGRVAGGAAMGLAAGAGALYAGKEAISDWKSGHKGRATSFGVGGLALGAGAIAAVVAGAFAPVTLALVGIGGAIVGLTALWKHHSDFIKSAFKKVGSFIGKALEFFMMFNPVFMVIKWLYNKFGGGNKNDNNQSVPEGAERKNIVSNIKDALAKPSQTYGKMKVAKDGSITNLSKLTQNEASEALQAYEKADPTSFNRVYEWADKGHANMGSFETDAVKKVKGQKTGALMYKGASADLDALRTELINAGMEPAKANALVFTSGKLTGSNKSHGVGGWKSHNNSYALGFDLGGGSSWTEADYNKYGDLVADFYGHRGKFKESGGASQTFNINYEKAGQGKSTGRHWDVKPTSDYRPSGAVENEKEYETSQKAVAERHSIDVMTITKKLKGDEELAEMNKEYASKSPEEYTKALEKELKDKYGIYSRKDQEGKEHWIYQNGTSSKEFDPSANLDFAKTFISKVSNEGV